MFGSPVGAAPLGLNTYVNVGNVNDPVSQVMGRQLSLSGGVENSRGFLEGNATNPNSYRSITTDFVVQAPAGQSNKNHSWQYYLADPVTRSGLGLAPLNDNLRGYYGRSQWKVGE